MSIIIKFIDVRKDSNVREVKKLYENSFPKEERYPFNFLLKSSKRYNVYFWSIYDEENFIGLIYLIEYKNILFIGYFAINKIYHNSGYGSKVLKLLREKFKGYDIILYIEEIDKNSENYSQRLKRKQFYKKNGFFETDLYLIERNVSYEIMSTNKNIIIEKDLFDEIYSVALSPVIKFLIKMNKIKIFKK